jgi:hypothetical protein
MLGQVQSSLAPVLARVAAGEAALVTPPALPFTVFTPVGGGEGACVTSCVLGVFLPTIGENVAIPTESESVLNPVIVHPTARAETVTAD